MSADTEEKIEDNIIDSMSIDKKDSPISSFMAKVKKNRRNSVSVNKKKNYNNSSINKIENLLLRLGSSIKSSKKLNSENSPVSDVLVSDINNINSNSVDNITPNSYIKKYSVYDEYNDESVKISWTDSIEKEILEFAELCTEDEEEYKKKFKLNDRISKSFQASILLLGAVSLYTATSSSIQQDIKDILQTVTGGLSGVMTSVYNLFGFSKKAVLSNESSSRMRDIVRKIKVQLLKPIELRTDPFKLIFESESERDNIIKKMNV